MKTLLIAAFVFLSTQAIAQSKSAKTPPTGSAGAANPHYQDSAMKYRVLAMRYRQNAKGLADTTAMHYQKMAMAFQRKYFQQGIQALPPDGTKALKMQYQDSVTKYRELATYYQQNPKGPGDTTAAHYQNVAAAFQHKHIGLNKQAIKYNDSLANAKRKADLEKKYNIKIN